MFPNVIIYNILCRLFGFIDWSKAIGFHNLRLNLQTQMCESKIKMSRFGQVSRDFESKIENNTLNQINF